MNNVDRFYELGTVAIYKLISVFHYLKTLPSQEFFLFP